MWKLALFLTIPLAHAGSIGVYTDFEQRPSGASLRAMEAEVGRIMNDIKLEWRAMGSNAGTKAHSDIIVLRFRGECRPGMLLARISDLAPFSKPVTLGATQVADGSVLPVSEVRCDAVKQVLGARGGELALGKALGRVVAHELVHILSSTRQHAAHGLMKPVYTRQDLAGQE